MYNYQDNLKQLVFFISKVAAEGAVVKCAILTFGSWTKVHVKLQTAPRGGGVSCAVQPPSVLLLESLSISCIFTAACTIPQRRGLALGLWLVSVSVRPFQQDTRVSLLSL